MPTAGSGSGGAAGSAPIGLVLDSTGRSRPPFGRLSLLPGRCWASGTASLFHGNGYPRRSRGVPAPPAPGVHTYLGYPGGAALSKQAAAAAVAVAMDTRAAPIGEAFWGRGLSENHTHFGASRGHIGRVPETFAPGLP